MAAQATPPPQATGARAASAQATGALAASAEPQGRSCRRPFPAQLSMTGAAQQALVAAQTTAAAWVTAAARATAAQAMVLAWGLRASRAAASLAAMGTTAMATAAARGRSMTPDPCSPAPLTVTVAMVAAREQEATGTSMAPQQQASLWLLHMLIVAGIVREAALSAACLRWLPCASAAQICTLTFLYPAGAGAGASAGIGAVELGRHHGGQDSQAGYDTRHTSAGTAV